LFLCAFVMSVMYRLVSFTTIIMFNFFVFIDLLNINLKLFRMKTNFRSLIIAFTFLSVCFAETIAVTGILESTDPDGCTDWTYYKGECLASSGVGWIGLLVKKNRNSNTKLPKTYPTRIMSKNTGWRIKNDLLTMYKRN